MKKTFSINRKQGGMALIEALIAMLVLALGIFGLIGIQARTIVDTRITNVRAQAIRQIGDLNERIWLNRQAALDGAYNLNTFSDPGAAPANCDRTWNLNRGAGTGSTAVIATCDLWRWRSILSNNIAGAQAQVQRIANTNQIRILVAWPVNEKDNAALDASLQTTDTAGNVICPDGFICHLQFLEL